MRCALLIATKLGGQLNQMNAPSMWPEMWLMSEVSEIKSKLNSLKEALREVGASGASTSRRLAKYLVMIGRGRVIRSQRHRHKMAHNSSAWPRQMYAAGEMTAFLDGLCCDDKINRDGVVKRQKSTKIVINLIKLVMSSMNRLCRGVVVVYEMAVVAEVSELSAYQKK